jgi:hypothetical protein
MHKDEKHRRMDDGEAFLPDPQQGGRSRARDDLAETLAEEFLSSATSGEEQGQGVRDQVVAEELGGPFVPTSADDEMIDDVDEMNPLDATAEPFPRAVGGR